MKQPPKSNRVNKDKPLTEDARKAIRDEWRQHIALQSEVSDLEMRAAEKRDELRSYSITEIARRQGVSHSTVKHIVGSRTKWGDTT